ncbi:MAG TPA: hypothetical protein VFD48_06955, partial [Pyrinomonadaceae bacterium]|nr:hypothetical protein [Pyrinomonadaceae bacterium]
WMRQQHDNGSILFSGPTPDRKFGIYVIRADPKLKPRKLPVPIRIRQRVFAPTNSMNGTSIRSWASDHSLLRSYARTTRNFGQLSGVLNLAAQKFAEARDRDFDSKNMHDPPERGRSARYRRFLRIVFELLNVRD